MTGGFERWGARLWPEAIGPRGARTLSASRRLRQAGVGAGRVRLHTLVLTRWIAVVGQTTTILIVYFGLGYDLPLVPALAVVGTSAALNVVVTVRYPWSARLNDAKAATYLAYDTVQLAVLLSLTGGLHNPFSVLMLGPVTIAATILSIRSIAWVGALSLISVSVLIFVHLPLPWPGEHYVSHLYVFGIWASLVVGMLFFSFYILRIAQEGRRMSDALTETQMALMRQQHLSAVGALAAATAHKLGTPLSTIAVAAKEALRDLPAGSPLADDLRLIVSQSDRCRDMLARLTLQPEAEGGSPSSHLPLASLVETVARSHRRAGIRITVETAAGDSAQAGAEGEAAPAAEHPVVPYNLEIVHGLGDLIENAVDFARSRVWITVGWSEREARVEIADDGPGFARDVLAALGEPYVSTRRESGGLGLGVFIAKTVLERSAAEVRFGNYRDGGASVVVTWPRAALEAADAAAGPTTDGPPATDGQDR